MPLLFISHSSKDKAEAEKLVEWLEAQGVDSLFLDSDAQHGIKAGSDWEKTLYQAIRRSHAFIFLISDHWIASQWCGFEFMQARALGKIIFPIRIQAGLDTEIASDLQHLDFNKDRDDALQRLQSGISEITLNTRHHVAWDTERSPYPGMMAFEAEDAPVFFGRDNEINRLRERLDQHRTQGSASLLVLLAASGAGKSSLLKAGLLPRLQHHRHWLATDALRPQREPLRQLAQVLANATGQIEHIETLLAGLQGDYGVAVLRDCIQQLQTQHQQWDSSLLLTIDQAEELFTTAEPTQTRQLLDLLAAAQAAQLPVLTLLSMRSDYLETLQQQLSQLTGDNTLSNDLFTLDTLPMEQIGELIRGPAEVTGLTVEDGLLTAATKDAANTDALPLLAFALRELYERFGGNGDLTLDEYQRLGSDQLNPLENAVQQKAAQAIQPEQLSDEALKALRDAFIPHMVRVNDSGDYVRQPARWDDLPVKAHDLLDKLTNARLLVQHTEQAEGQGRTEKRVEVAHEALLRHWALLNSWLREEHDFLLGKQQLEHSLREWQDLAEDQQDKGLLRGIALERGREWLFADKAGLSAEEKDFIRRSHQAEEQQRKGQRNRLLGFVSALVVVAGVAIWQAFSATEAEKVAQNQEQQAQKAREQAEGVINFMVFDLRDKLEPIGRLGIMRDVQERVGTYYDNAGDGIKNQQHLWQRATNRINRGDTEAAQGNLKTAEQLYHEANQFMQQRADSDPSNAGWQRDLSVSLNKIGNILSAQGKLDEAKAVFEKDLAIAQTLADNDPSNAGWQRDLSVSFEKIAGIYLEQEILPKAAELFQQQLTIIEKLMLADPSNVGWQTTSVVPLSRLLTIEAQKGNIAAARQHGEKALNILKPLAEQGLLHGHHQQWIGAIEGMLEQLN